MLQLINRETGKPPTADEQAAIERRAAEILHNPYATPKQMEWAMMTANPNDVETIFWESCREIGQAKRARK